MTSRRVIEVPGNKWQTPLTKVEDRRVGDAQIRHESYPRGYYRMEGFWGSELYQVTKARMPVTLLERRRTSRDSDKRWKTWMVDDPLHWIGMGETVKAMPPGRVVVAGLGLGLMLHHMSDRDDLSEIVVVEIDQDVIDLIRPTLPDDERVQIVCQDYYQYLDDTRGDPPDSVLWDLAVGDYHETVADMARGEIMTELSYGKDVPFFQFGRRSTSAPEWLRDTKLERQDGPLAAHVESSKEGE